MSRRSIISRTRASRRGFPDLASPLNGYPPIGQLQLWNETGPPKITEEHGKLLASAKLGYSPELEAFGLKSGIPYWQLWVSFHGPAEVIEAQWKATQRHFGRIAGARFDVADRLQLPVDPSKVEQYHEPELGYSLTAGVLHRRAPLESDTLQGPHVVFCRLSA